MTLRAACVLLLALASVTARQRAEGQAIAPLLVTSAARDTPAPRAVTSSSTARIAVGALGGAVIGGAAGYLIVRSGCHRCDDGAPMLFGATLGAIAGGAVGIAVARQSAYGPARAWHRRGSRASPRLLVVVRVAR